MAHEQEMAQLIFDDTNRHENAAKMIDRLTMVLNSDAAVVLMEATIVRYVGKEGSPDPRLQVIFGDEPILIDPAMVADALSRLLLRQQ